MYVSRTSGVCQWFPGKNYVRKLFTPGWYRVNLWVSQTMLNHDQDLFFDSFCLFGEFAKVFERQVWRVPVAHLHSAARVLAFKFISQQILTKIFFVVFCAEMLQQFSPTLLASCVFLSDSETSHCENKLAKKFW